MTHWKPLPVMAVISTRYLPYTSLPALRPIEAALLNLSLFLASFSDTRMLKLSAAPGNFEVKRHELRATTTTTDLFPHAAILPQTSRELLFVPWHGSTLPLSLSVPALPDQEDLRCIIAGTGAVPTDNVTWLSTKES